MKGMKKGIEKGMEGGDGRTWGQYDVRMINEEKQ
jgi:hypothetical protein